MVLHPVSAFIFPDQVVHRALPAYWYEGRCPTHGHLVRLPRTVLAEAIAQGLMQQLAAEAQYADEGKMYGVLLVETPDGERQVLQAFSGLLHGNSTVAGWVPPIPGRDQVALAEAQTLAILEAMKQELIELQHLPVRQQFAVLCQDYERRLQALRQCHQQRKADRQQLRQHCLETLSGPALAPALEALDDQSRRDGIERRRLKAERDAVLQPLQQAIAEADLRMRQVKQQRQAVSRQLQEQMHAAYRLTNFLGETRSLTQLMPDGSAPTGTGDCCAPKLLHYAATHALKPLAMAEFWWGPPPANGDKVQGEFYGACVERCQPLMGFLLSGLPQRSPSPARADADLAIVYADAWLVAVNKPSGLLSVPGRYCDRQDSVLTRLRLQGLEQNALLPVHRLDQDTSGLLLLARDRQTYHHMSQQFQQRQVHKVYEAVLAGSVAADSGVIDLPLWVDPHDRPRQRVDWQRGKPSVTEFEVMARTENYTRVRLTPVTGRTHQLRVHMADPEGLGVPILGDRLYGSQVHSSQGMANRLHLHAKALHVQHPDSGQILHLEVETPF